MNLAKPLTWVRTRSSEYAHDWRARRAQRQDQRRERKAARFVAPSAPVRRAVAPPAAVPATARTDDLDVPVPRALRVAGVWLDRTVGSLPLIAPLAVSGYYTFHVGTDDLFGVGAPWPIALLLTLALEGGAWKLAKLYEKRLVAGYSTIMDRLGIGVYLTMTASLIYWYTQKTATDYHLSWVIAGMCALGVFIWGRQARWNRRADLAAAGRLDAQMLRIGLPQWIASPIESPWAWRHGVRFRIDSPVLAVEDYRQWKAAGKPDAAVWVPVHLREPAPVEVPDAVSPSASLPPSSPALPAPIVLARPTPEPETRVLVPASALTASTGSNGNGAHATTALARKPRTGTRSSISPAVRAAILADVDAAAAEGRKISNYALAEKHGVSEGTVRNIIKRRDQEGT